MVNINLYCSIAFTILLIYCPFADAQGNEIQIHTGHSDSTILLMGREWILLRYIIQHDNSTNHRITYNSTIFTSNYPIILDGPEIQYSTHDFQLQINKSSKPGVYDINFTISYDTKEGIKIASNITKTIELVPSFEIVNVSIPHLKNHNMQVQIKTYVIFNNFSISFNSDGNIEVAPETIYKSEMPIGMYNFTCSIKQNNTFSGNQQISFFISAEYNSQILECGGETYDIFLTWEDIEEKPNNHASILLSIIIIIILINFIIFRKFRKE